MNHVIEKAKQVKCLICDVDGVLTDALVYMDNQGGEFKRFNIQDGLGIKLLILAGIHVAVITGSNNVSIDRRMEQLGIRHYFKGQINKQRAYDELKIQLNLDDASFAYIGDDLPDLPIMQQVGMSVAVSNAVAQVKEFATWQTQLSGGKGAVREACDLILNAQSKLDDALGRFLAL